MALPFSTASAFLRDPDGSPTAYKHDGFGHDARQDAGLRTPCFRQRPHSGFDGTGRGPIYSIAGGVVKQSMHSPIAGWYLIEDVTIAPLGNVFPVYFHAAGRMAAPGSPTAPGTKIGDIGDTGSGTAPGQYHVHVSVATSLAAAQRLVVYGTRARYANETVDQWAAAHGLIDPMRLLKAVDALASKPKPIPAPEPEPEPTPEDLMFAPTLYLNKTSEGMRNLGVGIFDDGRVEALNYQQWEAWQMLGAAKPIEVTVGGHGSFLMEAAARARKANVLPAPVVPATLAKQIADELGRELTPTQIAAALAGE